MSRVRELDVVRGFAVCGIMLVNTWQLTVEHVERESATAPDWIVENLMQSRFYPIFSFLFGVSFWLFMRSAAERTPYPSVVMLRRLAVLACLGLAHQFVNPGEVLLPYALTGAVLLLPLSYLPRWVVAAAGAAGTVWAVLAHAGGIWLVPGLCVLGMAAARFRPPRRALPPVFVVATVLAVGLTALWEYLYARPAQFAAFPYALSLYSLAGLAAAVAYCAGLLLLLRLRPGSFAVLESLGRVAVTAYLSGTLLIMAALPLLVRDPTRVGALVAGVLIAAAQAGLACWWLARHRYGPLEWAWRCATWGEIVPNRRAPAAPAGEKVVPPAG
ncbi:DUF418 domain-containing protein [Sphaerisporangium sp. TRM90804]|uniref:DUF418 domain-containing protein n=1 Tax=Sphaerisporangium sp. TRM90804 TaxID=3031113 RepID=UPI002448F3D2|nr:DUF418 domain-containing protein [Sphaerisporangium sp. TRM90804]MDH2424167.1 DUF418 domain-containing protein [Sphaerisporangium sp. TRM90804]